MRSAMREASQLPGGEQNGVDDILHLYVKIK